MKYEYSKSNIRWIDEFPVHWDPIKLKRVSQFIDGGVWGDDVFNGDEGTYVVRSNEITIDGKWGLSNVAIRKLSDKEKKSRLLRKGDLIVVKSSGSELHIGKTALVDSNVEELLCAFSNFTNRIRPYTSKVESKYLWYLLNFGNGRDQLFFYGATTTGLINLNAIGIGNVTFALPPKPEQTAITNYLDKACAEINRVVEIKQKQIENLQLQLKSILQDAVTKGLNPSVELVESGIEWIGKYPRHWKLERLKDISDVVETGSTPPTSHPDYYEEGTIPWYGPSSFTGEYYLNESVKLINKQAKKDGELKIFSKDTLLIIGIGATIGKTALLNQDSSCNQQINVFKLRSFVYPPFILFFVKRYEDIIINIAQFTTLPIFNQARMGMLNVLIAPIKEQKEIAAFLIVESKKVKAAQSKIEKQIGTLLKYKKSLIHEVITGKKQVYDHQ